MPDRQPAAAASDLVHRINEQLDIATGVARSAADSADEGDGVRALAMLRDVERPIFEVMTLLNSASLLRGNHQR